MISAYVCWWSGTWGPGEGEGVRAGGRHGPLVQTSEGYQEREARPLSAALPQRNEGWGGGGGVVGVV